MDHGSSATIGTRITRGRYAEAHRLATASAAALGPTGASAMQLAKAEAESRAPRA